VGQKSRQLLDENQNRQLSCGMSDAVLRLSLHGEPHPAGSPRETDRRENNCPSVDPAQPIEKPRFGRENPRKSKKGETRAGGRLAA
jgi:hypothetical protein